MADGQANDDTQKTGPVAGEKKRGSHKIFLGYAAGVGKTYTMLAEAQRRYSRGEDLVIGFVEPHKRPETMALMEGLERVPTKKVPYRGTEFEELDTDAVLARKPAWVLVDELAHTNVPGTRHQKRWQSVDELLDAGINVISTVNVQHFESLNDVVAQITGIRVRETIPDRVLDEADEVVLVDITPEALINRLKRGAIYQPDKVDQALTHFFRKGNLVALRELSLRKTTEEVDEELERFIATHDVDKTWGVHDRVLVPVTARPASMKLVRRGYQLSHRLDGDLWVIHVRPPAMLLGAAEEQALEQLRNLTREFGGHFVELTGDNIATEIIEFARTHQVTFIVMGQSVRSRWDEILHGSIVTKISRETRNIDVVIVAGEDHVTAESMPT
ncbi:MAG: universal stress protein [Coriobacteriales bacterium]|nr:universal stress protein [Coriobacteriales bacterium]